MLALMPIQLLLQLYLLFYLHHLCRFRTVAYLLQIWWFEVRGEVEFFFPEGTYSLFYRTYLGRGETVAPRAEKSALDLRLRRRDMIHSFLLDCSTTRCVFCLHKCGFLHLHLYTYFALMYLYN
jgi:hypothetical protein